MMFNTKTIVSGVVLAALAGCSGTASKNFNSEAGAFLDEGGFGNPTMQNMMAQLCSGQAKGFIVPDPVVVADPNSSASNPTYRQGRILCSGHLNGKYAQVIFGEFVESGTAPTSLGGGLTTIESSVGGDG